MRPRETKQWIWYLLPSQVATQGLSTVIPLYVIFLGGGIGEDAMISSIQNGAVAVGSIFSGKVIDRFHARRSLLLFSFLAVLLCSIGMYFTNSIVVRYEIVPIVGFFM